VIQGCNLLPTPEEARLLREAAGPLEPPDALLLSLSGVPDLQARVEALSFRYVFDEVAALTHREAARVAAATAQVRTSARLKDLLRVVLVVGNKINQDTDPETRVRGFTLASLLKLSQTKSLNRTTTVLDFLTSFVRKKVPDLVHVAADLDRVAAARRLRASGLDRTVRDLRRGVQALSRFPELEPSTARAVHALNGLEAAVQHARAAYADLLEYFGEDAAMESDEFFDTLQSFMDAFGASAERHRAKEERVLRAERARAARRTPAGVATPAGAAATPGRGRPSPGPPQPPQLQRMTLAAFLECAANESRERAP